MITTLNIEVISSSCNVWNETNRSSVFLLKKIIIIKLLQNFLLYKKKYYNWTDIVIYNLIAFSIFTSSTYWTAVFLHWRYLIKRLSYKLPICIYKSYNGIKIYKGSRLGSFRSYNPLLVAEKYTGVFI